jgi:hypothetical protein
MRRFRSFRVRLPSGERYWTVPGAGYRPPRHSPNPGAHGPSGPPARPAATTGVVLIRACPRVRCSPDNITIAGTAQSFLTAAAVFMLASPGRPRPRASASSAESA